MRSCVWPFVLGFKEPAPTPCPFPGWIHAGTAGTTPSGYHKPWQRALASGYLHFPAGAQPQQQEISMQTHMSLDLSPWKAGIAKSYLKKSQERHFPAGNSTTLKHTGVFKPKCVFMEKKRKREIFFFSQETLLSIPNTGELWISPMVCRGGAQCLFGYSQSWSSVQAERRRMPQLSVRMGYSMAGRNVGIKLLWIRQVCSTISPCLTKEMFHGSYNRGSLIPCVIPMNSDYIYI